LINFSTCAGGRGIHVPGPTFCLSRHLQAVGRPGAKGERLRSSRFARPWSRTKNRNPVQMQPPLLGVRVFPIRVPLNVSYTAQHEMRRTISIALLMIVSWILVVPLLPSPVEVAMSCCRMSGKHHCTCCSARSRDTSGAASVARKCPCPQPVATVGHSSVFALEAGQQEHLFASISGTGDCPLLGVLTKNQSPRMAKARTSHNSLLTTGTTRAKRQACCVLARNFVCSNLERKP